MSIRTAEDVRTDPRPGDVLSVIDHPDLRWRVVSRRGDYLTVADGRVQVIWTVEAWSKGLRGVLWEPAALVELVEDPEHAPFAPPLVDPLGVAILALGALLAVALWLL